MIFKESGGSIYIWSGGGCFGLKNYSKTTVRQKVNKSVRGVIQAICRLSAVGRFVHDASLAKR